MSKLSFTHFTYLPMSMRVLFTMVLLVFGTGYLMAMIQVWESHAGRDGKPMLSAKDLIIAYNGNKEGTKLESALRGPMASMLPEDKREVIFTWLHEGAKPDAFSAKVEPIIKEHCVMCHAPTVNPHLPDLTNHDGVMKVAAADTGMTVPTLVRVSHIHLFSITFIFFITGFIFTHAYIQPVWMKCLAIAVPFLTILTDVGSWYLTKIWQPFAWVVIGSGALMGLSFAFMWLTSMYQLWFYTLPENIEEEAGKLPGVYR